MQNAACFLAARCAAFPKIVRPVWSTTGVMAGTVGTAWTWGWSSRKGSGSGGRSREDEREERPLPMRAADSIGYARTRASGESLTTKHRILHASGPHPIQPPDDPNGVDKWVKSERGIGYARTRASGESLTTKHRILHASGPHPIQPPDDPNGVDKWVKVRHLSCRVSMTF
ncbi:minichromosome maintenance protein 10 [Dorcoceras hygrometricum]|uniref:Minichromosome maintenance protein 10 n=1 Tax=Dorcoceras hygrometricum TaxID=472368 RepID=A0A2Z7CXF0_9LAMI|nr:minichromosome maintenance protein 10 [Dorcoceras hygrometricum]